MGTKARTHFLVATPSLGSGMARLFDWYGQFDQYSGSGDGAEADARAMASDWRVVGDDMRPAIADFDESNPA